MFGKKNRLLKITINAIYVIAAFWVVFGIYWLLKRQQIK